MLKVRLWLKCAPKKSNVEVSDWNVLQTSNFDEGSDWNMFQMSNYCDWNSHQKFRDLRCIFFNIDMFKWSWPCIFFRERLAKGSFLGNVPRSSMVYFPWLDVRALTYWTLLSKLELTWLDLSYLTSLLEKCPYFEKAAMFVPQKTWRLNLRWSFSLNAWLSGEVSIWMFHS